jgi:hypothetical protein
VSDLPELSQREINDLEQAEYDAQKLRETVADEIAGLLSDLKRDRPGSYRFIVETFATVGRIPDVDDLVTEWTDAREAERAARRALPY